MARDFRRELADAAKREDVAELLAVAYQLLGRVEADDERRAFQANKKRNQRDKRVSGTSGMSPDVPGRPETSGDVPMVEHTITTTTTPLPSAQVIAKLGDARLQASLDQLRDMAGAEWEDVASFFLRRKYSAWQAWADVMLKECGPGSQYSGPDLAKVCRDDGTLDKRIGSGGIFRTFLGYARRERAGATERAPPSGAARSGRTSRRDTNPAPLPVPPTDSPENIKWQT